MEKTQREKTSFVIGAEIPQDRRAERAFLGAALMQAEVNYELMDVLKPDAFYFPNHRAIFEAMTALIAKHEPVDILTVTSRLEDSTLLQQVGGKAAVADLIREVPSAANIDSYARIIQKKYMLRRLIAASAEIGRLGYDQTNDIDEILDEAEKKIFSISNAAGTHKYRALGDELKEAAERLVALSKTSHELRGVPSGFRTLDDKLSGFQKSDLIILAARPSMGKTSLALDIARRAATEHNIPVGIFSLEMSAQQLVDRMLSAESMVDSWKIRTGRVNMDEEFSKITNALERLSKAPIYIDDQPGSNILKIRSTARRLVSEKGLRLIIVDYLQLITPTDTHAKDSTVQQVTEISRSLKNLARELNIPVIALSQLSRAIESRGGKPRLSDLRDSGCLSGDTLITRADTGERIPIKELVGKRGIPIFSLHENYRLTVTTMDKIFSSGFKQLFEITTRSGRAIKASANHPFRTLGGWSSVDKLKVGDHVALARSLSIQNPPNPMQHNELILLAHLIGDGCILPKQPYHYTSADPANIAVVREAARALFNIDATITKQKNWQHVYLPSPYPLARGKYHPITLWYQKLGLERARSYKKKVPEGVFMCSQENITLFLRHLWATDGNISWKLLRGRKPAGAIYYATASSTLARDVQHLLLRCDILSSIRKTTQKNCRPMYGVHIQGSAMQLKFCRSIGSYGERGNIVPSIIQALEKIAPNTNVDVIPKEIWGTFIKNIKDRRGESWRNITRTMNLSYNGSALMAAAPSRMRLEKVAHALADKNLEALANSDLFWDSIVSITPSGVAEVFDATVPNTHNFLANDMVVHNSIEQDADVVMFIHREDKYKEDSERPNIAEILIEKHRNGPTGKIELYFDDKKTSFIAIDKSEYGGFHEDVENF